MKIERADDIEIWIDTIGTAHSSREKMYISSGLERVVWNGDIFIFEGGLRCSVVDVLETHFTVWAKEEGIVYKNSTVFIPEKHDKIPIV